MPAQIARVSLQFSDSILLYWSSGCRLWKKASSRLHCILAGDFLDCSHHVCRDRKVCGSCHKRKRKHNTTKLASSERAHKSSTLAKQIKTMSRIICTWQILLSCKSRSQWSKMFARKSCANGLSSRCSDSLDTLAAMWSLDGRLQASDAGQNQVQNESIEISSHKLSFSFIMHGHA